MVSDSNLIMNLRILFGCLSYIGKQALSIQYPYSKNRPPNIVCMCRVRVIHTHADNKKPPRILREGGVGCTDILVLIIYIINYFSTVPTKEVGKLRTVRTH